MRKTCHPQQLLNLYYFFFLNTEISWPDFFLVNLEYRRTSRASRKLPSRLVRRAESQICEEAGARSPLRELRPYLEGRHFAATLTEVSPGSCTGWPRLHLRQQRLARYRHKEMSLYRRVGARTSYLRSACNNVLSPLGA